jgi:hypothetical protein
MPAPLAALTRLNHNNNLSETEDEEALAAARTFDPDAKWVKTDDNSGYGFRLEYNNDLAPKNAATGGKGLFGTVPVYEQGGEYINDGLFKDDEQYGRITDARNLKGEKNLLETYAPLIAMAIGAGGPALGTAFLGATGIGLGAAGTAGVTGGAAGLGAGNIAAGGASSWLTDLARRAPTLARSQSNGFNPMALLSGSGATGSTLATLLRLVKGP